MDCKHTDIEFQHDMNSNVCMECGEVIEEKVENKIQNEYTRNYHRHDYTELFRRQKYFSYILQCYHTSETFNYTKEEMNILKEYLIQPITLKNIKRTVNYIKYRFPEYKLYSFRHHANYLVSLLTETPVKSISVYIPLLKEQFKIFDTFMDENGLYLKHNKMCYNLILLELIRYNKLEEQIDVPRLHITTINREKNVKFIRTVFDHLFDKKELPVDFYDGDYIVKKMDPFVRGEYNIKYYKMNKDDILERGKKLRLKKPKKRTGNKTSDKVLYGEYRKLILKKREGSIKKKELERLEHIEFIYSIEIYSDDE